jgi:MFS transporter, ACDE family, multidrug resistance protein
VATETGKDEGVRPVYEDHNLLQVLWGITLMAVLGTSSITPAFPTIVKELGVSSGQVGLLITFFTLPGIVMTPVLGVLSDRYGRKKILVPALLLFGLAGGACAFARSFDILLALRFFQGMGAAALGILNLELGEISRVSLRGLEGTLAVRCRAVVNATLPEIGQKPVWQDYSLE